MSTPVTRLANYAADSAARLPISSAEVDSEFDMAVGALNRKVVAKSTAPSSPVAGDTWCDTTNNIVWLYSGSAWIELPTVASPSNGQILQYDGTHWTAVNSSSGNAVEMTDAVSVATSTRARATNVVTIVTGSAHGLTNGDKVDIIGMTDTTFNAQGVTVTVSNGTTFTFSQTGADVVQGSDTGGTVKSSLATDASAGSFFYVTIDGSRYLQAPTNPTAWQKLVWIVTQDTTGNWNITLDSVFRLDPNFGTTLTINPQASKTTYIGAIYNDNDSKWDVLAVSGYFG